MATATSNPGPSTLAKKQSTTNDSRELFAADAFENELFVQPTGKTAVQLNSDQKNPYPMTEMDQASGQSQVHSPVIRLKNLGDQVRQFQVLRQFEGRIGRIDKDWFEADVCDLTDPKNPVEVVELSLNDISESDKNLIRPGCVFYWIVGYETRGGQILRVSEIRVRRAPVWGSRQLEVVESKARELFNQIKSDGQPSTNTI